MRVPPDMVSIGYFLSCEEFGPRELVRQARLAQAAGFERLWISDHFHPWTAAQGHSPFVWSVIGALSEAVMLPVTTAVTCPTVRIHPAIISLAGRIGDGYCTTMPDADLVRVFRETGDPKRPVQGALKVCWAETEQAGVETAHRLWASELLPGQLGQTLPRPKDFEAATSLVTRDAIAKQVPCGPDLPRQVEAVQRYVDAGFDEVYVQQIGSHHEEFFRAWSDEVLPALR